MPIQRLYPVCTALLLLWGLCANTQSNELDGALGIKSRIFKDDGVLAEQGSKGSSVYLELQYFNEWDSGRQNVVVDLFYREDADINNREKVDPRDLYWAWYGPSTDVFVGYRKVFWGVTEFKHLVDVVNQTDLVDDPFGNQRMGQPMASVTRVENWGIVDLFVLTGFRERTFPGRESRLRPLLYVDTENPVYEHPDKDARIDFAARSSHTLGNLDVAFSYFNGTSREPSLIPERGDTGDTVLRPHYGLIRQTGLELQWLLEGWVLKAEGIDVASRSEDARFFADYRAYNLGVEKILFGIFDTGSDLGLFLEYMHDDRDAQATSPFENDVFVGGRISANDIHSSSLLLGLTYDLEHDSRVWRVVGERSFGTNLRVAIDAAVFDGVRENELIYDQRNDSYIGLELNYFFGSN